ALIGAGFCVRLRFVLCVALVVGSLGMRCDARVGYTVNDLLLAYGEPAGGSAGDRDAHMRWVCKDTGLLMLARVWEGRCDAFTVMQFGADGLGKRMEREHVDLFLKLHEDGLWTVDLITRERIVRSSPSGAYDATEYMDEGLLVIDCESYRVRML